MFLYNQELLFPGIIKTRVLSEDYSVCTGATLLKSYFIFSSHLTFLMIKKCQIILQLPLGIVDLLVVDSLVIVNRFNRTSVYFSMYFSCNSRFSRYIGQFAADGQFHYYKR